MEIDKDTVVEFEKEGVIPEVAEAAIEAKPVKIGGRIKCQVCVACEENKIVDDIVHKEKFDKILPLSEVVGRIFAATGVTVHKVALLRHYKKHISPAQSLQYERQVTVLRSFSNKKVLDVSVDAGDGLAGKIRYTPKAKYSFDMLHKLKQMFVEMSGQFEDFQKTTNGKIDDGNVEIYSKIADSLTKIARDIARIEASKEVNREIVKHCFLNIYKVVIKEFIQSVGAKLADNEKEELAEKLKSVVVDSVKKLDTEFKRKMV